MYSIAFPDFLSASKTNLVSDHAATLSNLKLLLYSDKMTLIGDPYFGTHLKKLIFEQNDSILADLVIDDIYTAITTFLPQISIKRENITLTTDRENVFVKIECLNLIDYQLDTFNINLTKYEEGGL